MAPGIKEVKHISKTGGDGMDFPGGPVVKTPGGLIISESLVGRQGSRVSMRVARVSASLPSSHGMCFRVQSAYT